MTRRSSPVHSALTACLTSPYAYAALAASTIVIVFVARKMINATDLNTARHCQRRLVGKPSRAISVADWNLRADADSQNPPNDGTVISQTCEYCQHVFPVSTSSIGQLVQCPRCAEMCDIPDPYDG
jgi:hypothetical protein